MKKFNTLLLLLVVDRTNGFVPQQHSRQVQTKHFSTEESTVAKEGSASTAKAKLLGLLGKKEYVDPVLADPVTKEPLKISAPGVRFGGERRTSDVEYKLVSSSDDNTYGGSSNTYFNLLEPVDSFTSNTDENDSQLANFAGSIARNIVPMIPPPIRSPLARAGFPVGDEYVPMRDLFTSPYVSFAYERGWRQGFAAAGFPGPDKEAEMAADYFTEPISRCDDGESVLVDMSCATGLFTRRFTKSEKYARVLGCDYSDSMLTEARRRINLEGISSTGKNKLETRLDLVRCDVGKIPMRTGSVDALHAGAAMHCWPDLPAAVSEIHRVLKPGGRYFATTFLSTYFGALRAADGGNISPTSQAFQYFESVDQLRNLLIEEGGFSPEKVSVEVLEPSAVVIRCEK